MIRRLLFEFLVCSSGDGVAADNRKSDRHWWRAWPWRRNMDSEALRTEILKSPMSSRPVSSKWIEGLSADQPVSAAARSVLELRLAAVWERLPMAALEAEHDPEHVHQLRVASRRAHAALRVFAEFLPRRRARRIEKHLHRVRRAAGAARDCDVQLAQLQRLAKDGPLQTAWVTQRVAARRAAAQTPIVEVYERLQAKLFPERIAELLHELETANVAADATTFGAHAAATLRRVSKRFFKSEASSGDGFAALHRFRIQAKEMRYSLEIFSPVWPGTVRGEVYPVVERLQELLGDVVDSHVAIERYHRWQRQAHCDGSRCALRALVAHARAQLTERLAAFRDQWTPARSDALRAQLDGLGDQRQEVVSVTLRGAVN